MISKKELNSQVDFLTTLREILEAYEEIAASRMARIRSNVLKSRDFLLEINAIFQEVKTSYRDEITLFLKRKKIKNIKELTFLQRNGKTLFVLISANTGFYGEIIRKTYNLFLEYLKQEKNADVLILGRLGFEFFEQEFRNLPHTFYEFPDDRIDKVALKKITEKIVEYQKVLVFYEQFVSVVTQSPIVTNITGDPLAFKKEGPKVKYFFEPTLEKIMAFFEKEIVASIFEQTILESELAKFAARMVSLDASTENTKHKLTQILFQKERAKHRQANKEQLEKFSSMGLWSTG